MVNRGIRLPFRILGITLVLDWSFLLILPLLAWMIGTRMDRLAELFGLNPVEPLTRGFTPYLLGFVAAVGLFIGIGLHEFGHAVTARLYGVKVRSITLWFLGGLAQFDKIPRKRAAEAVVAIVGPIVSLLLAGVCWLGARIVRTDDVQLRFVLAYLTYINLVIAGFNLLPALPLDGGRILRSLLALVLPYTRATRIACTVSKVAAVLVALVGVVSLDLFLLLIALFIYLAVKGEDVAMIEDLLRDVPVRQVMNRRVRSVPPDIRVDELLQRMLCERHLGFPVVDSSNRALGVVTIEDAQRRDLSAPVGRIMSRTFPTIGEDERADEVFRRMSDNGFTRIIVNDAAGKMVGIVTKTDLLRLIQLRSLSPEITASGFESFEDVERKLPASNSRSVVNLPSEYQI